VSSTKKKLKKKLQGFDGSRGASEIVYFERKELLKVVGEMETEIERRSEETEGCQ
jgi:hypothetical protein